MQCPTLSPESLGDRVKVLQCHEVPGTRFGTV
jgi:hypothetical protein